MKLIFFQLIFKLLNISQCRKIKLQKGEMVSLTFVIYKEVTPRKNRNRGKTLTPHLQF